MFDGAPATDEVPLSLDDHLMKALDALDLERAQSVLIEIIVRKTGDLRSWDSPQYATSRRIQDAIVTDRNRDWRLTFFALETLRDRYFLRNAAGETCETPQDFFARVATGIAQGGQTVAQAERSFKETLAFAQSLYDALSQLHALFATPILTNAGTTRGALISCFLSETDDSIESIFATYSENAALAQGGGGVGTYWPIRAQGSSISRGGKSSGPIPFLKTMESATMAVHQAGARRGAAAAYMDVSHPDIETFVELRKHEGDVDRRAPNLHHGVNISDAFMQAVKANADWDLVDPGSGKVVRTISAYGLWKKILVQRVENGEPYMIFIDTVNRAQPETYKRLDKGVHLSNLCTEVLLPTAAERIKRFLRTTFGQWRVTIDKVESEGLTAICDLGSLNMGRYFEWQHYKDELAYLMMRGLDNALDHFIATSGDAYDKAKRSAQRGRDVGLGVLGWFDYLQQRRIPFESIEARSHNKLRFAEFQRISDAASRRLAFERGPAPDVLKASGLLVRILVPLLFALGLNRLSLGKRLIGALIPANMLFRNVNRQALAPTATIGIIAGGAPSIEPPTSNAFKQNTLSGTFIVKNENLRQTLRDRYPDRDNQETWTSIFLNGGSVQHLDWLTDEDRKLFKTAEEINQREIVTQGADRTPFISQAQSLNLFIVPGSAGTIPASYLHEVHMMAYDLGVKSTYYCRSQPASQAGGVEGSAEDRKTDQLKSRRVIDNVSYESCAVCQ